MCDDTKDDGGRRRRLSSECFPEMHLITFPDPRSAFCWCPALVFGVQHTVVVAAGGAGQHYRDNSGERQKLRGNVLNPHLCFCVWPTSSSFWALVTASLYATRQFLAAGSFKPGTRKQNLFFFFTKWRGVTCHGARTY